MVLTDLTSKAPWFSTIAILFICAAIAAIMSTVDSALLSISSMFSQDIYKPLNPGATQRQRLMAGKIASWVVMALGAFLAITLKDTIWRLIVIKLEILCQIAPGLILGLYIKELDKYSVLWGMIAGTVLVVILMFGESHFHIPVPVKPWNFHSGIWGLLLNLLVIWVSMWFRRPGRAKAANSG